MMNVCEMLRKMTKNNQTGFGMIQALMMVAAVAGGIYTVTLLTTSNQKVLTNVKQVSDVSDLNINLTNNVRTLFLETAGTKGLRTGGICELVRVSGTQSPLANIYMLLPDFDEPLFGDQRWEDKFEGYVLVEQKLCDENIYEKRSLPVPANGYKKCLQIDVTSNVFGVGMSKSLAQKYNPYIEVIIEPVYTNPIEDNPFVTFIPNQPSGLKSVEAPSNSNEPIKYDVKSIGYQYKITTSYVSNTNKVITEEDVQLEEERKVKELKGFTWSGEAGNCDLVVGDQIKELALTGTGPGSTANNIIQNYAGFTKDSKANQGDDPLEVTMISTQVQAGKLVGDNGRTITSDDNSFVYASCNERTFRCSQDNSADSQRLYDSINLTMNLEYNSRNKISNSMRNMSFSPTISFRRNSGNIEIIPKDYEIDSSTSTSTTPQKNFVYSVNFDGQPYDKYENGRFYRVFFKDVQRSRVLEAAQITVNDIRSAISNIPSAQLARQDSVLVLGSSRQAMAIPRRLPNDSTDSEAISVNGVKYKLLYFLKRKVEIELSAKAKHELTIQLADEYASESDPTANATCRSICTAANQYNAGSDPLHPVFEYKANVTNTLDDDGNEIQTEFFNTQAPIACTSCYMKNCSRFGLGTFGAMDKMPTEPGDAGIPECVQYEAVSLAKKEKPSIALGESNANKCVALKLKDGDMAGFEYIAADCTENKNVMCFNYGKHLLAADFMGATKTLVSAPYSAAANVCFNTSKEMVNTDSLVGLFNQQGFDIDNLTPDQVPNAIKSFASSAKQFMQIGTVTQAADLLQDFRILNAGSTIQGPVRRVFVRPASVQAPSTTVEAAEIGFFNLANQGSFFAPTGGNQEEALREYNDKENAISDQQFWVGLKTDNLGYLYAPAPVIPEQAYNDSNKWSLSFNNSSLLLPQAHDVELALQTGTGKQVGLLYNHIRYRGVAFANEEDAILDGEGEEAQGVALRFICRDKNSGEIKITEERSKKISEGYAKCNAIGGIFIPPVTTAQWENAIRLVHANDVNAAYPIYNVEKASDYDPAWVALDYSGDVGVYTSNDFLSGDVALNIKKNGEFKANGNVKAKLCFDENSADFVQVSESATCSSSTRELVEADIAKLISSSNIIMKSNLIAAIESVDLGNNGNGGLIKLLKEEEAESAPGE